MDTKKFRFVNKTRDHALSQAVTLVDSTFEPLTVLRVMVEGLAHNEAAGLWLTRISDLPSVPRLAPFDIIYLDKNQQIVEASELLPAARLPRFGSPATTALVLPFQTISKTQTAKGDELEFFVVEPAPSVDSPDSIADAATPSAAIEVPEQPVEATPTISHRLPPARVVHIAHGVADPLVEASSAEMSGEAPGQFAQPLPPSAEVETPVEILAPLPTAEDAPPVPSEVEAASEPVLPVLAQDDNSDQLPGQFSISTPPESTRVSASELELASALDRALASAEMEFEAASKRIEVEHPPQADEPEIDPALEPRSFASASVDAAELLRNSRSRKRRPNRQVLPRARKSRAGLHRPDTMRSRFIDKPGPKAPETIAAPDEQPLEAASEPLSLPVAAASDATPVEVGQPVLFEESPVASLSAESEAVEQVDSPALDAPPDEPAVVNSVEVAPLSILPEASVLSNPPVPLPREAGFHIPARPGSPFEDAERDGQKSAEPVIGRFLRWLYPAVYQEERRTSVRWPAPDLVAYQIRGESLRKLEVRNISSTGIYVLTGERWKPGETIQLSLQKSGLPEQRVEHRVEVEAGAARYGKDGVGLTFALPPGMDLDLWNRAIQGKTNETGADYIIKEIRMARAIGCLRRICTPALDHARMMLHKEFSNVRVANAIKIILKTETLLAQEYGGDQLVAHPETVVRILELGSWVDTDWIEDLWAGLLATSCTVDGQDCSNRPFVEMLSQFAPIHLRVLGLASAKARHEGAGLGLSDHDYVTAGELARALDVSNLTKILRTIAELSEYGLLTKAIRSPSSPHDASAKTAVTQLGLEMFARCHGLRETLAPAAWHGISTVIVSPAYTGAAGFMAGRRH